MDDGVVIGRNAEIGGTGGVTVLGRRVEFPSGARIAAGEQAPS